MNAMLSLCYHMQRAPEAILHQDRMGHVDGRRQTPGRGLRQRDGCWDALGGRASGRPGPLPPRHQEGLRHRGQRHLPRYHPVQAAREGQEGDDEGELARPGGGHRSEGRPKLPIRGHLLILDCRDLLAPPRVSLRLLVFGDGGGRPRRVLSLDLSLAQQHVDSGPASPRTDAGVSQQPPLRRRSSARAALPEHHSLPRFASSEPASSQSRTALPAPVTRRWPPRTAGSPRLAAWQRTFD
eukprot:CAMPEP_0118812310 /NCGR_PEP_ID=MMETSP1162-20130426/2209_1 /TAXON_ID=33656 /ORGANISM="Phaeocystis Sp, Strain CCMP2710" /LENGTH=238 /DNA_ID=CAMNT_0006742025 /DNA_START=124 /DNA_END=839 /DNA_ORIENTATION=+